MNNDLTITSLYLIIEMLINEYQRFVNPFLNTGSSTKLGVKIGYCGYANGMQIHYSLFEYSRVD